MLAHLRVRTGWRLTLAVLVLVALAVKMMVPAGFMPGTSMAVPIVLCPDQGPMPTVMTMAHGGHHAPSKSQHDAGDHPCAFAGLGIATLSAPLDVPDVMPTIAVQDVVLVVRTVLAPGHGLAAPPPPSHAPPAFRA